MKNLLSILLLMSFTFISFAQKIDSDNSKVEFKIGSVFGIKVKGDIIGMKGEVNFDANSPSKSSFNVSVNVSTINTGNNKRDTHLKNEDFFEVEKFPTITFKSNEVIKTEDTFITKGQLTIKDITKNVSIPFTVEDNGDSKILKGDIEIERLDYNLGTDQGSFLVNKTANVTIVCILK